MYNFKRLRTPNGNVHLLKKLKNTSLMPLNTLRCPKTSLERSPGFTSEHLKTGSVFKYLSLSVFIFTCSLSFAGPLSAGTSSESMHSVSYEQEFRINIEHSLQALPSRFALDTADNYNGNWRGLWIPVETARRWDNTPAWLQYKGTVSWNKMNRYSGDSGFCESDFCDSEFCDSDLLLNFTLPFRRDLEAWFDDPAHSNMVYGINEPDINVPYEGFLHWNHPWGELRLGRFDQNLGESPHRSVILSGSPWEDALFATLEFPVGRYLFYAATLNPVLTGTPAAVDSGYPAGSEEYVQRTHSVSNAHKRVYAEPYKSLLIHGVQLGNSTVQWGIYEQMVIGGKSPVLRDFSPWAAWHNNYGDGFTNTNLFTELGVTTPGNIRLYVQTGFDEVTNPMGAEGYPTQWSFLSGVSRQWKNDGHHFAVRIEGIYASPFYGHFELPLVTMASRKSYRSNYRDPDKPGFADTWLVDYPLGYWRGMNLLDLWADLQWISPQGHWKTSFTLGNLRQGNTSFRIPYDEAENTNAWISGIEEREWRLQAGTTWQSWSWLAVNLGGEVRKVQNADHVPGNDKTWYGLRSGLSFVW